VNVAGFMESDEASVISGMPRRGQQFTRIAKRLDGVTWRNHTAYMAQTKSFNMDRRKGLEESPHVSGRPR